MKMVSKTFPLGMSLNYMAEIFSIFSLPLKQNENLRSYNILLLSLYNETTCKRASGVLWLLSD